MSKAWEANGLTGLHTISLSGFLTITITITITALAERAMQKISPKGA